MASELFIVGLGNPGAEYEFTRHNVGFMLIDRLARETGAQVKRKECRALVGRAEIEGRKIELVKPQTFMNLSGEAVSCLLRKDGESPGGQNLIVISDDIAIPFGTIRIRPRGSSGGQKGLKSIITSIKSDEFIRLRIGIQPDHPVSDTARYVLDEFSKNERVELEKILERSADALRVIIRDGVEKAMATYN